MPTPVDYIDLVERDGDYYYIHDTELRNTKGQANGLASLDNTGKVPSSQLPDSTDTKVTQTATSTNANYEVLFSGTADNTTRTEGAGKAATLRFNPSKGAMMEGSNTVATGSYSHAEGYLTTASGEDSHAEGESNIASGWGAHAEGYSTTASGDSSHAEGEETYAYEIGTHTEGRSTTASYGYAHAEGIETIAGNTAAHAEGWQTSVSGAYGHAEGQNTYAGATAAHAEGYYTCASGIGAHAEGGYGTAQSNGTFATGENAHAEGYRTTASGNYSHAEGYSTSAKGTAAHSEGGSTTASGNFAHAEGNSTRATGGQSHAEGLSTTASGVDSHAEGQGTCAAGAEQTVVGKFNVPDTTSLFIVGNGTSISAKSNALKVGSDGTTTLGASGTITSGNTQAVTGGAVYTALGNKLDASLKGAANGVAELDSAGLVPSSQLPSYVDDVIEVADYAHLPITGESGKIYVTIDDNKEYRWSGTTYVEISASLALGETSSTAYRGDRGKTAYDHATDSSRLTTATASGLYKVASTAQGHIASLTAVVKADITALGIPGSDTNTHRPIQVNGTQILGDNTTALNLKAGSNVTLTNDSGTVTIAATDTTYSDATTSASGLMSASDKTKLNGIASGAEVNQNAFSTVGVKVGSTTTNVAADSKTDTVTLIQGSNVTLTPDTANDTITIASTDTDRYVNSASFAHDSTNDNVKMTLTRAGSDTATVTGNIPKVSSSSAGVAPKGAAVSSQSQTTKFLREDGSWAAPSYTSNTDTKVTQNASSDNADYRLIFSNTADDTNRTETAKKSTNLTFNPYYAKLNIKGVGRSWIDTGKLPQIYASKPSTDGATGILGIDTKDGRIVLGTYPSSTNYLYFSYFTNTTLAGSENKTDKQMFWEADDDDLHVTKINNVTVGNSPKFTDTTYTAGIGLQLVGTQFLTYVPRISSGDANYKPGNNKFYMQEYSTTSANIPESKWQHILTTQGSDGNYSTQLALGMTGVPAAYYRRMDSNNYSEWYRITNAVLQRYETGTITNNTWYRLFKVTYNSYNYLHMRVIVKAGYDNIYEAFICVRFTPNGMETNSTNIRVIPTTGGKDLVLYQIDDNTIALAVKSLGANSTMGFEIRDIQSESNTIKADGITVENPFVTLSAKPAEFGNHRYITGNYADINGTPSLNFLPLSGGTMTGVLTTKGSVYEDSYSGALNMNNSNIYGVNSIYTADTSDTAAEGINFYRDATHVDTLWMNGGDLLFVPNRALGTSTSKADSQKVGRFTTNPTSGQVVITDGTTGGMKSSGYTIATSVPSGAVFTDAKVTQTATTTSANYEILLSGTADNTTRTEGTLKTSTLLYNPSTGTMSLTSTGGSAEGGELQLRANTGDNTRAGTILDNNSSQFRIFGIPSADGTTKTGTGTPLVIDPYAKTITGGYTITGSLSGNASTATSATKATQDSDGNAINTTYLKLAGGTMTGDIIFNKTGATDLTQVQMKCGTNDYGRIAAGATASNSGYLEIATADDGNEPIYARQYSGVYSSLQRTATILDGSGNTSFPGKLTVSKAINELLTGSGTTAQDKGSGVSPRYFPALWKMNVGIATPSDGDTVTIKIPCAGHDFGTFLSLDNGTTYKPIGVVTQSNSRLTTHYPSGRIITLVYDSTAVVDQVFAAAGADARSNITGAWKVITSYHDGNTYDRNVFGWTSIKAWGTALVAGNIIVGINGVFHHLKEGTAFDITYPILYLNANVSANGTHNNVYDCLNFTITTTQSITLTQFLPVYIKGTLNGTTFTPVSTTPLTQTVPTAYDGYVYIELGIASSTTSVYMEHRHKMLMFLNGKFGEVVNGSVNWSGFAGASNYLVEHDYTTNAYSRNTDNYRFRVNLTRQNKCDINSSSSAGGILLAGNWTSNAYNAELFIGMGDNLNIFYRGVNNGTYTSWYPIGRFTQTAPTTGQVIITDGTGGGIKSSGYTIATSVPSGAVFTDAKVTQTPDDTTDSNFEILLSGTADNTSHTEGARKSSRLLYDPKYGRTIMKGPLLVQAANGVGSYDEGIRINAGKNGYATLCIGGAADTVSGTADAQFWMGTNPTNDTYKRKLFIAHAGSTASNTYFYADSASQVSPHLKVGGNITADNVTATSGIAGNTLSVTASNGTSGGISLYSSASNIDSYGIMFRGTGNKGVHGYVQGDWATYFTMHSGSGVTNRGWVFRNNQNTTNVASINQSGNAVFNGSVTIGGNATNTSGARMVYDSTSKAINFEFL